MDQVPGWAEVRLVHRVDLCVRGDPDGDGRRRDIAANAPARLQQHGLEPRRRKPSRPDLDRGDHARGHHGPQHLQHQTGLDHQQHRRLLRDRGHGGLRDRHADRAPAPTDLGRDQQRWASRRLRPVLRGDVHEPVRHLRLRHCLDACRGDERPEAQGAPGGARLGERCLRHRRHIPARDADGDPEPEGRDHREGQRRLHIWTSTDHRRQLLEVLGDGLPARRVRGHLRMLHVHHGGDSAPVLRHGPGQPPTSRGRSARSTPNCTRRSGPASRSRSSRPSHCSSTQVRASSRSLRRG